MTYQEIQREFSDHLFLSYREIGGSKKLVGDIIVIVFFVDDNQSSWTEEAKKQFIEKHNSAMQILLRLAKKNGVNLKIRNAYGDITIPLNCTKDNYLEWSDSAVKRYNASNINEYQKIYKDYYKCDECPILFVFNKSFRSCAISVNPLTQKYAELSIISYDCRTGSIIHELLHQFGAADLYFPSELKALVQKMNYESIMLTSSQHYIDSLTAYLIGWKNEVNDSAATILRKTSHYTFDLLSDLIEQEWKNT
ncbi:MAG: hypothetical protein E7551_07340 [Ruminococcaceae bacterium]|nr:hypothetical protein [Oscillospiraceae bacterium]